MDLSQIQCVSAIHKVLEIVLQMFCILFFTSVQNRVYKYISSTPHFLNLEQWIWCVKIETGSTRTQTIPNASKKDVTSQNQTHAPKKRTGCMLCASSFMVTV